GTSVCSKHGARRDDIADKAQQTVTLATLLASDPRPVFEVLQDAIHTLDSVHRKSKMDALKQDSERGSIDAETVTELVNASRGAAAVSLAATRTAAWQAIAQSHERRVHIEAKHIAAVLEAPTAGLFEWINRVGEDANTGMTYEGKRSSALGLRDTLQSVSTAEHDRDGRPILQPAPMPPSPNPDDFVLTRRAELEALRECARRHTPQISDRPADVYVPDDADITSPAPESPARSTSDRRPPEVGLISTTATRHYRGR